MQNPYDTTQGVKLEISLNSLQPAQCIASRVQLFSHSSPLVSAPMAHSTLGGRVQRLRFLNYSIVPTISTTNGYDSYTYFVVLILAISNCELIDGTPNGMHFTQVHTVKSFGKFKWQLLLHAIIIELTSELNNFFISHR